MWSESSRMWIPSQISKAPSSDSEYWFGDMWTGKILDTSDVFLSKAEHPNIFLLKGILSCWENFWYVKTGSLVIPNQFLIFPNSTSNPPKFTKNYFFLVRNSTQMALTAPLFPLNWCQRLQNLDRFGVNGSKILIKLVSTTPKSVPNWCQRLQIFTFPLLCKLQDP